MQQQQQQQQPSSPSGPPPILDEDAVAAADKEMEERANRAKELLSQRHKGLRVQQVSSSGCCVREVACTAAAS